jgi:uncharacterized membrane protein
MGIKRILRHLTTTDWQVNRTLPRAALRNIEEAIGASEATHTGQICIVVEGAIEGPRLLKCQSARERAVELFSQLRVWDTEHNNGVLVYLLLADRDVEILADRGIHQQVGDSEWERVCHEMEQAFRRSDFAGGLLAGIQSISSHLSRHFPRDGAHPNELPDAPRVF